MSPIDVVSVACAWKEAALKMEISSCDVEVEEVVQLKTIVRSGLSLAPLAFLRREEGASGAASVAVPERQVEGAGEASSSTGDDGWWYNKPQYDLFPDEKTKNAYNFYLRRRQINLWVLVPFMAITVAVAPVVLPREVFPYGSRYQIASAGILCQVALQYALPPHLPPRPLLRPPQRQQR